MQHPAVPTAERRPIATRNLRAIQAISRWLVRRNASPNGISVAGMIAGVLAGVCLAATSQVEHAGLTRLAWLAGAVFVQVRLLANLFDGMVAIDSGQASPLGELFNEVPDRVSDAATLIGLGWASTSNPAFGFIAALLAVFTAYVRAMGKIVSDRQDYCGPMAKPQRMFLVTLCALLMAVLPVAWQPDLQGWSLPSLVLGMIVVGCLVTAVRRLSRTARLLRRAAP